MATATNSGLTSASRKTARPTHGTAGMRLSINGTPYRVRPLSSPDGRAYRLIKVFGMLA